MKYFSVIIVLWSALGFSQQGDIDFELVVSNGPMGGYADVTYFISNLSPTATYTNVTINHPDAVLQNVVVTPSTLPPGIQVYLTGRIPLSGDNYAGIGLRNTQATLTASDGTTTITELSDGRDFQGNSIDDGPTDYFVLESPSYGVIYIDDNLNGQYDAGIDTFLPQVRINLYDSAGNTDFLMTNETGWWYFDNSFLQNNSPGNFTYGAIIDVNTLPANGTRTYQLTDGDNPFIPNGTLAFNFNMSHGFVSSDFGTIEASAFLDENNNGMRDTNEVNVPYVDFEFIKDNDPTSALIINSGNDGIVRRFDSNPGIQLNDVKATLTNNSSFYTITTPDYDDITTTINQTFYAPFALTENSSSNRDTAVYLTNVASPNPGFASRCRITIDNRSPGISTGNLQFTADPNASILNVFDQNGNDLLVNGVATATTFGFVMNYSIPYFSQKEIDVVMDTPITGVQMGDVFTHNTTILPTSIDVDSGNNTQNIDISVIASYDPNDITEIRGPSIPINLFSTTDFLEYTIRFQNEGTANAQFVRILSSIDAMLDLTTLEMLSSSHSYTYTITGNELDWYFDNIQLVPQSVDEQASQGYIKYRIKPRAGFSVGDVISAQARIFFDYNPAVFTEEWTSTFDSSASINDSRENVTVYPNPINNHNELHISQLENGKFELFGVTGIRLYSGEYHEGVIKLNNLSPGIFFLKVIGNGRSAVIKLIKE